MYGSKDEIERLKKRIEVLETKVDNLLRNAGFDVKKPSSDASNEVMELLLSGRKVEAIKTYRIETGASLKDAKEYIESLSY